MTDYPDAVYSPRTKQNKKGLEYDEDKTEIGYVEDITKLDDEIIAIETELGLEPKGDFDDVAARLEALALKSYFAIGIANKKWMTCFFTGGQNEEIASFIRNESGENMFVVFGLPLPLTLNGKNLVITKTRIGLGRAEANNYITRFRIYGMPDFQTQILLIDDQTDVKTPQLKTYDHVDQTIGGAYKRVVFTFNFENNARDFSRIYFVQAEYYYAEP